MKYLVILVLLAFPFLVSAFGVSPPFINQNKLVPGSHYEQVIFLSQGKPENNLEVTAEFETPPEIRKWFSVDKGSRFVIPAGVQQYPITVIIDIPENAELGIYHGFLRIRTTPPKTEGQGSGVAIAVGARVDINLIVGDEVFADFVIKNLDILDIKEGEPPQIVITLENIGNVSIAPERAALELFDKYGEIRLGFAQVENLPKTPSFKINTFTVKFPIDIKLGIGEYWANARIYKSGVIVAETKTVFNVIEKKVSWLMYVLIAVGILILAGIPIFIIKRRKKSEKREPPVVREIPKYEEDKSDKIDKSNRTDRSYSKPKTKISKTPKKKTKR